MKQFRFLPAVLLAGSLVSCSQLGSPSVDGAPQAGDVIVITSGAAAPVSQVRDVALRPMSVTEINDSFFIGSKQSPVAMDGCEPGDLRQVTIPYSIKNKQAENGSFMVSTRWTYMASGWVGTEETTVNVPARAEKDPVLNVNVGLTLVNDVAGVAGPSSFKVEPFGLETRGNPGLGINSATATIHVDFIPCESGTPNTRPSLGVLNDIAVEATSSDGAVVTFNVTASDAEEGDLTDSVVCSHASGDTFRLGETKVVCSVTDRGDLTATESFTITVLDRTPPVFAGVPTEPVHLTAANIDGAVLDIAGLGISAADHGDVSPPVTIACSPADGSVLAIGSNTTVECTATDSSVHTKSNESDPVYFDVIVGFAGPAGGLLQPVKPDGSSRFQPGRVVPIKFKPPMYEAAPATDLAAGLRFYLVKVDAPGSGPEEYTGAVAGSTEWRYDATDDQYVFNLSTKGIPPAKYEARVEFKGVLVAVGEFTIR